MVLPRRQVLPRLRLPGPDASSLVFVVLFYCSLNHFSMADLASLASRIVTCGATVATLGEFNFAQTLLIGRARARSFGTNDVID